MMIRMMMIRYCQWILKKLINSADAKDEPFYVMTAPNEFDEVVFISINGETTITTKSNLDEQWKRMQEMKKKIRIAPPISEKNKALVEDLLRSLDKEEW